VHIPQSGAVRILTSLGNSGLLNRFLTEQGHCGACRRNGDGDLVGWPIADSLPT